LEKHPESKVVDILRKTWGKMSDAGRRAARGLPLSDHSADLLKKALQTSL
jgi:hypothetical protein